MRYYVWLLLIVLFEMGCTNSLRVRSNPDRADVYVVPAKGNEEILIGRTPFEIELDKLMSDAFESPNSRSFVVLRVKAREFETKDLMVPLGTIGAFNLNLDVKLKPQGFKEEKATIMIRHMMNAQEFINNGDLERADIELEKLAELDDKNTWLYVMRGHIYYLKKDLKRALLEYERALQFDPNNQDLVKRIGRLRQLVEGKENEKR